MRLTVVVADDSPQVLDALRLVLEPQPPARGCVAAFRSLAAG